MLQSALDFSGAAARADMGIDRASRSAERLTPQWVARATELLRVAACVLHQRGVLEFTVEALRLEVEAAVPAPPDKRAWGAATRSAVRNGWIERLPGRYCPAASSNCSPKPLYRKGRAA